jgi:nitroreductase
MRSFLKLAKKRRSIRSYTDKKIERKDLELCVEAARYAPSACNSQPWSFVIIDSRKKVSQVAKACVYGPPGLNSFAREARAFIAIISERQTLPAWLASKLRRVDFRDNDIGIATSHIVLQAQELGIGSCILGWFNEGKIKKILSVPFHKKIELIIAMGYPADIELAEKKLKEKDKVVKYNSY